MRTLSFWLVELVLSHRSVHNLTRLALMILDCYNYALLWTLHNETQKQFFVTRTMYIKHDQFYIPSHFRHASAQSKKQVAHEYSMSTLTA